MRVAVVTNYDKKNYGSVLQAYALQSKIKELGSDECVVYETKNNKPKSYFSKIKRFFSKSKNNYSLKNKIEIKKSRKLFVDKYKKIENFCKSRIDSVYNYSYQESKDLANEYDVFIAGSDQIWSPNAGTLSDVTLLDFANNKNKYSYAASIGVSSIDEETKNKFKNGLSDFKKISVRENTAKTVLGECVKSDIRVDIDPTLLYDGNFWKKHVKNEEKNIEPYIFVYMLRPEPVTIEVAKALSKKYGYKVKICSNRIVEKNVFENVMNAGIEDFLTLINNAEYVITNSFHGTVFSLQFMKKFLSIAIDGTGSRVIDLLKSVNLSNHIVSSSNQIDNIDCKIDWNVVNDILLKRREESIAYLRNILEENSEEKVTLYASKKNCCGCGACMNVCPRNAISMKKDIYGFIYPEIDQEKCIKCGLCKKVCNYQNQDGDGNVIATYAAVSKDENVRHNSSSGGVFASIAKCILEKGGLVYGCSFENCNGKIIAKHIEVDSEEQLYRLQGSKYVQSEVGGIYKRIGEQISENPEKLILFSGTPCQVAGLKGYLKNKEYSNLFFIELICHGVPNNDILQSYVDFKNFNNKSKIVDLVFRDKDYGWGVEGSYILDNKKKKKMDIYNSSYYKLYLKAGFYRDNCYSCRYATEEVKRPADITIGDYWGFDEVEKYLINASKIWDTRKGISCIVVNSNKGKTLLEKYGDELYMEKTTLEKICKKNTALVTPTRENKDREKILSLFYSGGYAKIEEWYKKKYGFKNRIYKIWNGIPVKHREKIKKIKKIACR